MTKAQLIAALADLPDDATVFLYVPGEDGDLECQDVGKVELVDAGEDGQFIAIEIAH